MAIILGVKQSARTYQLLQEKNNFSYINSSNSSNLLFLNVDENTNNNAVIRFKNNYEIGYIDNNISIFNLSNLITINSNNINLYKDTNLYSNFNVNNYLYTSNNTTYFNNNVSLNLNNNINNSFKINNNSLSIFDVSKNIINIRTPDLNIFSSNIRLSSNSILYTNFIDSPNDKPVVIRNMAFAESLRIFTANIVQNMSLNNDILFSDLLNSFPQNINPYGNISDDEWTQYMVNNNINILDPLFIKPNINVIKYLSSTNNVGGSNILEFNIKYFNTSNNSNLIFSINNKGYLSIGSNYNQDIPLKININPISSNIIQYTNINDSNKCFSINSNGFMNIGSTNFSPNQINIFKNNNRDLNNSDLISLNINNINNTSNIGSLNIRFNNNNNYTDFIFDVIYSLSQSSFNSIISNYKLYFTINITHMFIINNILTIISPSQLYNNGELYSLETSDSDYISLSIKYPANGITITEVSGENYILIYKIYPSELTPVPSDASINNTNLFNKIVITKIGYNIKATFIFYIYIGIYTYSYNGKYYPKLCNYITAKTNDLTIFNISQTGNVGIGTTYSDLYKLYIEDNALINNINCKTIDNYLTKNISMCNCILNDIDTINNADLIKSDYLISSNNFLSNLNNNNCIINSNLTVLSNGGKFIVNTKSIFGIDTTPYANYLLTINCSNIIDGLAIKNDIINNNPNLLIYSSCINSYPYVKLQSFEHSYNIGITSNNNFQIKYNNNNINIIENNYNNNSISLFNNSFNIFKDSQNNIKFYAGQIPAKIDWYNYISDLGIDNTNKSSFNIYGDFNVYSTFETETTKALIPLIICKKNIINNKFKIGIGIDNTTPINDGINSLMINYETIFNSNISVLNNIYLSGTILSISDCNLKTDIHKIENPLDKIQSISGYTYKRTDTGNLETGLIAQEVIKILPEVINYNNNNNYTISYGNMCGILVECIKELNEKIKFLNSRIDNMEK
jgi:hypothetical protein